MAIRMVIIRRLDGVAKPHVNQQRRQDVCHRLQGVCDQGERMPKDASQPFGYGQEKIDQDIPRSGIEGALLRGSAWLHGVCIAKVGGKDAKFVSCWPQE